MITRRDLGRRLGAGALGARLGVSAQSQSPNFVILLADDLGYGDLGCYGNTNIRTPHLDRMATEGARLTEFYAAPTCTPSRAALLTGRYPLRSGMIRVLIPREHFGLPTSEITLAQALKQRGYRTACIGKWHLGDLPPFRPNRHGFEYFYGLLYSNDMAAPLLRWPPLRLYRNDRVIESPVRQATLTQRYTEEAIHFIERSRSAPFFLYVAYAMPHVPLAASQDFRGRSSYGIYGDAVEEIDWSVGRIMAALARYGLDRNTVVVFSSDNGPALGTSHRGGSAGVLRGGKGTTWEGGVRVPCLIRWPARIPAGVVRPGVSSNMDLFTTFVEAAGAGLAPEHVLDGRNLEPFLSGRTAAPDRPFFYYSGTVLCAVRVGVWKLHWITYELGARGRPRGRVLCDPPELYNLESDPGEYRDVATANPEIVRKLTDSTRNFQSQLIPGKLPPARWRALVPYRFSRIT